MDIKSVIQSAKKTQLLKNNTTIKRVAEIVVDDAITDIKNDVENLKSEIQDKEFIKGDKPIAGVDYPIPKDGDDYILTEQDKQEIASKIEVPIVDRLVEKTIEKTEVIKEQPIITNEIKEVAKYETSEQIGDKINTLEEFIEQKAIKGLRDSLRVVERNIQGKLIKGGGLSAVVAGTNVSIDNSNPSRPIISSTGGDASTRVLKAGDTMTGVLSNNAGITLRTGTKLIFDGV